MHGKLVAILMMSLLAVNSTVARATQESDRYEEARRLYAEGPSKANEVVALLEEELRENPENETARRLLAVTLFGSGRFESTLEQLELILQAVRERNAVAPRIVLLKVRTLFELKKYEEAAKLLRAYWAFWQDDEELLQSYEHYSQEIAKRLAEAPTNEPDYGLVKLATGIVQGRIDGSLAGHYVIVIEEPRYALLGNDSDLGPFIKAAIDTDASALVLVLPSDSDRFATHCVFFVGQDPIGRATVLPSVPLEDAAVTVVPLEADHETGDQREELYFEVGTLEADDGTPVTALRVLSAESR